MDDNKKCAVAYGLFAEVDGKMVLQFPTRATEAECVADVGMYVFGPKYEVRALYDAALASQSQAAQPTDSGLSEAALNLRALAKSGRELRNTGEYYKLCLHDAVELERVAQILDNAAAAHIAGTSQATNAQAEPEDFVLMPSRLTAENGAKSLFMGEFKESVLVSCHECEGEGEEGCPECGGEGTVQQDVTVGWDTIKNIYSLAVARFGAPFAKEAEKEQQQITRLDVLSLIREHTHRCYVAGVDMLEIDPKYMQEIENGLRSLAESSDRAPTTSTVSAPEEIRNAVLEEAAETLDAMNDSSGDAAAYDQREQNTYELEREHAISDCAKAVRALKRTTSTDQANADTGSAA